MCSTGIMMLTVHVVSVQMELLLRMLVYVVARKQEGLASPAQIGFLCFWTSMCVFDAVEDGDLCVYGKT